MGQVLERVMRNYAVVVIGSGDQNGGKVVIVLDVVQGWDLGEGVKLVLVIRAPEIGGPRVTYGVAMKAEHVHDANGGDAGTIEIGTLVQTGAD